MACVTLPTDAVKLTVQTLSGVQIDVNFDASSTCADVKRLACERLGRDERAAHLVFGTEKVNEEELVCGRLSPGSTLSLITDSWVRVRRTVWLEPMMAHCRQNKRRTFLTSSTLKLQPDVPVKEQLDYILKYTSTRDVNVNGCEAYADEVPIEQAYTDADGVRTEVQCFVPPCKIHPDEKDYASTFPVDCVKHRIENICHLTAREVFGMREREIVLSVSYFCGL